MRLELGTFPVRDIVFGAHTRWTDGLLEVNRDELLAAVRADPRIATVDLELARPGESVRIWPLRDVVEPRVKVEPAPAWPTLGSAVGPSRLSARDARTGSPVWASPKCRK